MYSEWLNILITSYSKEAINTGTLKKVFSQFIEYNKRNIFIQFQYISTALNLAYNKNNLHKTLYYRSRNMLSFDLLGKGLEILHHIFSTALRCGSFSKKLLKISTCAVMIRIIITFRNQIFL